MTRTMKKAIPWLYVVAVNVFNISVSYFFPMGKTAFVIFFLFTAASSGIVSVLAMLKTIRQG